MTKTEELSIETDIEGEIEMGFLDYMELVDGANAQYEAVVGRMGLAMQKIGERATQRTSETETLTQQPSVPGARIVFDNAASDLNEFSAALSNEIPQMSQAHADLLKHLVGAAAMSIEMGSSGTRNTAEVLQQLDKFTSVLEEARSNTIYFQTTLANLPRMTATLNKAKRRAVGVLTSLISAFTELTARNNQVRTEIVGLLDSSSEIN